MKAVWIFKKLYQVTEKITIGCLEINVSGLKPSMYSELYVLQAVLCPCPGRNGVCRVCALCPDLRGRRKDYCLMAVGLFGLKGGRVHWVGGGIILAISEKGEEITMHVSRAMKIVNAFSVQAAASRAGFDWRPDQCDGLCPCCWLLNVPATC